MTPEPRTIAVVLVEPQALVRDALICLLNAAGLSAVADGSAPNLDDSIRALDPDVLLVAIDPGVEASIDILHELPVLAEHFRTLVLTMSNDSNMHARAIELGAMGVVTLDQPAEVLIKAIQKVDAGELWLDRARTAGVVTRLARGRGSDDPDRTRIDALTRREREIVGLVAEGMKNKQIADRLFISEATVRNHLTSILDKLELGNRFELAVYAFRRGLVSCPQTSAMLRLASEWKKPS
jgi:two-component system nitrate/nitrite response regulator NarL